MENKDEDEPVIVNNYTNINITNNRLSPQIIENEDHNMTCDVGNLRPELGMEQNVTGLNR
jgi:hypothetical protein